MFIKIATLLDRVPRSHDRQAKAVEDYAKSKGLDANAVPIFAVGASATKGDFEWVLENIKQVDGDKARLRAAVVEAVSEAKAKDIFDGRNSEGAILKLTKANHEAIVAAYAKGNPTATATATSGSNVEGSQPMSRDALMIAVMNFTGLPHAEVDAFLVPASERKVDNSAAAGDTSTVNSDTDNSGDGATADPAAPSASQPATVTENNEIASAANSQTPETPAAPVDNSGSGRDDSSAVSTPSADTGSTSD